MHYVCITCYLMHVHRHEQMRMTSARASVRTGTACTRVDTNGNRLPVAAEGPLGHAPSLTAAFAPRGIGVTVRVRRPRRGSPERPQKLARQPARIDDRRAAPPGLSERRQK